MDDVEDSEAITEADLEQLDDEMDARLLINRTRWQYRVVDIGMFNAPERLTLVLGKLGAEGWWSARSPESA